MEVVFEALGDRTDVGGRAIWMLAFVPDRVAMEVALNSFHRQVSRFSLDHIAKDYLTF